MGTNAIDLIRAAQGQGPAPEPDATQKWLDAAADFGAKRLEDYERHEDYYEGRHATELTDRASEFLQVKGVDFCENFAEPIVDMIAERLTVTGFEAKIAGDDEGSDRATKVSEWLAEGFWEAARMDETQGTTHTQALVKGDAYGIVGFDNEAGQPTFAFNRPDRVRCVYAPDDASRMLYAVKKWDTDEVGPSNPDGANVCRMNVYWPDRIERYFKLHRSQGRGGWAKWMEAPGEGEESAAWPTPWLDSDGSPLGIPVVHFRNKAQGRTYGRSELIAVEPQQNLLNKQILDLVAIMDAQGWPQRWVAGIDDTSVLKTAPGEVWKTGKESAKFGQFDAAPIEPVLAAIEATISRIARRSGMPLHLLTGGDMPSGESMKAAESRLVARCRDRATSYGNAWEDAARMAYRLARLAQALPAGVDVDPAELTLSTVWDDPESRNEADEATTAEAWHRLGVSKHTLLLRAGFDPEEEEERRKQEADEAMTGALVELMNGNADRTEPPTPPAKQDPPQ